MRYGGGNLWVTYEGEDAIARSASATGAATGSAGNGPAQLAYARGRVYVASRNDQAVITLDPRTLAPVGQPVRVGLNPFAIVADGRTVWVTGLGDNTLTRIPLPLSGRYTPRMSQLAPGSQIAGYRIDSMLGRGGMGVVYRAFQIGLERVVALKVIAPELLDDADVRERFLAEARAAASVDHPNVIPVHEAGAADGIAYIAMRFVSGSDLRSLVRGSGALGLSEAAGYVAQAARGTRRDPRRGLRPPRRQARQPVDRLRRARLPDRLRAGQARAHAQRRHRHGAVGGNARLRRA